METAPCVLLNSGYKMPIIGLGTVFAVNDEMRDAMKNAIECGYRSIDTGYIYLNEEVIGDVLQEYFKSGKLKREDVFISTKLPSMANRPEDVSRFLSMSLKKLKLDYLDLYIIHTPFGFKHLSDDNLRSIPNFDKLLTNVYEIAAFEGTSEIDKETDLEGVWKSLEKEVKAGRVKSIGVSNFNSEQIKRINKIAEVPIAVNQVEVHSYFQQHKLVKFCQDLGITVVGYGPFGCPYTAEGKALNILTDPTILEISKKYGKSASQIVLRSLIQRNIVSIPKSSNPERIKSNFNVFDFTLSEDDMKALAKLDRGKEGRVYHFHDLFRGCQNHKEYPFNIEF